jgi:hypothetical protein
VVRAGAWLFIRALTACRRFVFAYPLLTISSGHCELEIFPAASIKDKGPSTIGIVLASARRMRCSFFYQKYYFHAW